MSETTGADSVVTRVAITQEELTALRIHAARLELSPARLLAQLVRRELATAAPGQEN